jgi:short/branched chain acyl-CoA dehydrogenase
MSFELSKDHEDFRAVVRDFAEAEIAPHAATWDAEHRFPVEVVARMGDLGLLGLVVPEEYGGAGGDFTSLCVAIEELGRVDQSCGITLSAGVTLGITPIMSFGSAEQKRRWLPDLAAGRALAAFGLTEPDGGSDAAATRTRARQEPQEPHGAWVIDGAKSFITNSGTPVTSVITVTARTGERPDGRPEVSAILVPAGTPGLIVDPPYRKLGWHASDTHGLTFSGCRVPAENLLGERGRGIHQFLSTLDDGRIAIAALSLGLARACLEISREHARTRIAFGRPIGANQAVAFPIADLAVAVESARLLTYRAAWLRDECAAGRRGGAQVRQAAAMAKLHASSAAVEATRLATQVLGGSGFMEESPVARFYRDAKVLEIGEGSSEIQRLVLARGLDLPVH